MGITYFACSYPPELIDAVYDEPPLALTINPIVERWSAENGISLPTLDLDRLWHAFQEVTAPPPRITGWEYPRPAYRMFEGHITEVYSDDIAWFPWVRVIPPDETAVISRDLARLDPETLARADGYRDTSTQQLVKTYGQLLANAQAFTKDLADSGFGFVYTIG